MKSLFSVLVFLFLLPAFVLSEDELEFELEENLSQLVEELEERKIFLDELELEAEEVESEGEDFDQVRLEIEIESTQEWIRNTTDSIEVLSSIIEDANLGPDEKEISFSSAFARYHRFAFLQNLEYESARQEQELQIHEEEGDEETVDRLEARLDRLNERIVLTKEIHLKWEQVELARKRGDYGKADEMGHSLWVEQRDLDLSVELGDRKSEIAENQSHANEIRKESEKVAEILALSEEMERQSQLRLAQWEETKKELKGTDGEERHELLERLEISEEKFHLRNEIINLRKELVFAESDGIEEEADEINASIEELQSEIEELE